jgi:UDP-N-acetylglucosamine 4,6-dehydratase
MITVTGGTGSLGSAIVDRIIGWMRASERDDYPLTEPVEVISRDELRQAKARERWPGDVIRWVLSDICHVPLGLETKAIHCAALKRVEICEAHPAEAYRVNVGGTQRMLERGFVCLISTDKAVDPCSVYGYTKAIAEHLVLAAGGSVVRLPNMDETRGSVVETWREQESRGVPLTVTDPDATRLFIPVAKAVDFVLDHWTRPGLHIPAEADGVHLVHLMDLVGTRPYRVIGLRPGERRHERLG